MVPIKLHTHRRGNRVDNHQLDRVLDNGRLDGSQTLPQCLRRALAEGENARHELLLTHVHVRGQRAHDTLQTHVARECMYLERFRVGKALRVACRGDLQEARRRKGRLGVNVDDLATKTAFGRRQSCHHRQHHATLRATATRPSHDLRDGSGYNARAPLALDHARLRAH